MLEKIKAELIKFGEKSTKYTTVPKFKDEYKSLLGKKTVLVDDSASILRHFLPDLMVATEDNFIPILYIDETTEEMVEKILKYNPEVLLMDFSLSYENPEPTRGDKVIKALRAAGFTATVIGFSSDEDKAEKFQKAGADTSILKLRDRCGPDEIVSDIANYISTLS